MSMKIVPGNSTMTIAVINPKKAYGDEGQYTSHEGTLCQLEIAAQLARDAGFEIRWYYKNLTNSNSEQIASQVIITEMPPGHIQPFHTHKTIEEMTIVNEGGAVAVDSDTLTEADGIEALCEAGVLLEPGQMVIEGPGTRHTICNPGDTYTRLTTVQTARIPLEEFPHDWHRDKK